MRVVLGITGDKMNDIGFTLFEIYRPRLKRKWENRLVQWGLPQRTRFHTIVKKEVGVWIGSTQIRNRNYFSMMFLGISRYEMNDIQYYTLIYTAFVKHGIAQIAYLIL